MSKRSRTRRRRRRRTIRITPGASPGLFQVDPEAPPSKITAIAYDKERLAEHEGWDEAAIRSLITDWPVTWIDVAGLGDEKLLREIARVFGVHRLALEDVVNVHQRAKVDTYDDLIFVVVRLASIEDHLRDEQLSIILAPDYVLTFRERESPVFDRVIERIRKGAETIRGSGVDYLTYALLDVAVDGYFPVIEHYAERLAVLEEEVLENPGRSTIEGILAARHDLLTVRRLIWPCRELVNRLKNDELPGITKPTQLYLRDCYDHVVQVMDLVDDYREVSSGLMDLYLSSVSNRMNEIMKVLTITATVFIPLGFIAGLYGMNFDTASPWNMPELAWPYGYPFAIGLMLLVAGGMLVYFWRQGWIGKGGG